MHAVVRISQEHTPHTSVTVTPTTPQTTRMTATTSATKRETEDTNSPERCTSFHRPPQSTLARGVAKKVRPPRFALQMCAMDNNVDTHRKLCAPPRRLTRTFASTFYHHPRERPTRALPSWVKLPSDAVALSLNTSNNEIPPVGFSDP